MRSKRQLKNLSNLQPPEFFFVRENRGYVRVELSSIVYMEAQKNYVKIVTTGRTHLVCTTLTRLEQLLNGGNIRRVHRSFLINITHLSAFDRQKIIMQETRIPISELYYRSLEESVIVIGGQRALPPKKPVHRSTPVLIA